VNRGKGEGGIRNAEGGEKIIKGGIQKVETDIFWQKILK
jgi:hypothetical protein